ncbi:CRISPR-associated protein Cas4 [Thermostichus vulcanus]|uniref:CRISPR-associated exonuclease Cas4 n=1 Tax=Thermostichus vulcanus str. 'Rupite' TaxID=2813851 RepID=A0ABT0CBM0_THEVL|nr:CRISPR-associated protein Cas4 [Thermostichus vulcanus]MCJ2543089.1 CRISPR-associated protein Cas4 [Thermostichus vulcanus str. 'Rupite']
MEHEDEWIPISALQHMAFCPRQCALIHIEQIWEENLYTLRGQRLHERVHEPDFQTEDGIHVERAMPLWSQTLGLTGVADVVEFLDNGIPYPVEYKSGSKKAREADDIQLCAQALCLEEMLGIPVPRGAIYHAASKRRREVDLADPNLRQSVIQTIQATRELLASQRVPPPVDDARCPDCSLLELCMPSVIKHFVFQDPFYIDPEP